MRSINRLWKVKAILTLAVCGSLIGGVAVASSSAQATAVGSIPSGAGPGWPAMVSPGDFVREVTNPWFPLKPGSVWRYKGLKEGMKTVDVVTATHRTKKILDVTTTVVHDVVSVKGKPEEVTNDFYAQDRYGNVWYFGEETEELNAQGKQTSTEGSFEAGVEGARPGVLIPGQPKVGLVGRQEFLEGEAEDHFKAPRPQGKRRGPLPLHPEGAADEGVDAARAGHRRQQVLRSRGRDRPRDRRQRPGREAGVGLL